MDTLLDELDYKIYSEECLGKMLTNIGLYQGRVREEDQERITHIKFSSGLNYNSLAWATNLKFLSLNRHFLIDRLNFDLLTNLETLVIPTDLRDNPLMRELPPTLKTLIVRLVHPNLTLFLENNKLDNLPICLEKIIFVLLSYYVNRDVETDKVKAREQFYEEKDKQSIQNAIEMLGNFKRPFGCKIYICVEGRKFFGVIN
jgi:hypothetical protein